MTCSKYENIEQVYRQLAGTNAMVLAALTSRITC